MTFPPPDVLAVRSAEIATFLRLVIRAAELSGRWDFTPTSWYRTDAQTAQLRAQSGSSVIGSSQHAIATALDVVGPDAPVLASTFVQLGGIALREANGSWHLQLYRAGAWA